MVTTHPSGIDQRVVDKIVARRGRLHLWDTLTPRRTALVVVDLDSGTAGRLAQDQVDQGLPRTLVSAGPVNAVAAALRRVGGIVAWVTTPIRQAGPGLRAVFGEELARTYEQEGRPGGAAWSIWHELDVREADLRTTKEGTSAFFPGKSDLHETLARRGVDTLLIAGAMTNVCCDSSARDAVELGYRVTMVSDALIGQSFGLHEAALATFFRVFGDVRPAREVVGLLAVAK
jgi:ureidoacrylate peracid hydrolase